MTVTVEQLRKSRFNAVVFADMAKGGYMQVFQCRDFPRLMVRIIRETRKHEERKVFMVDDTEVPDIQAAAAALSEDEKEKTQGQASP